MDEEQLVLVDKDDNPIGTAGKLECHIGAGQLHRAFTALVFDPSGRLLLTRRSDSKMLWPKIWDATFASHPRVSESYADAAVRRMPDELGTVCDMQYLLKFVYHVKYLDVGSENEVCAILAGTLSDPSSLKPASQEISEVSWATPDDILADMRANPHNYCPWMIAALWMLGQRLESGTVLRNAESIAAWTSQDARKILAEATSAHMSNDEWGPVR